MGENAVSRSSSTILITSPRAPFAMSRSVSTLNVTITFTPIANSILFDNAALSFCFPRSQPTAASVLDKLLTSDNGFYAATPKLASRTEYFAGGQKNILVVRGKDTDEEFIIRYFSNQSK